jgi:ABC-type nitrate/sulfonate/bicarbonate transport system permease component
VTARTRGRPVDRRLALAVQGGTLLAVVLAWHVATRTRAVSPLILPELGQLGRTFLALLGTPATYHHVAVTAREFGSAMLLALGAGLLVGVLAGTVRYLGDLLEPVLLALYAVPIVMVFPFCILFFGIGSASKIAFGGIYAFFPIAIHTLKGLRHVDRGLVRAAVSMGAGPGVLLGRVMIPAALPVILTGVRIGAVLGLLSVMAGEMLGSLEGVGQMLARAVEGLAAAEAFAWMLVTILMVTLVGGTLSWLEARLERAR